MKAFGQGVLLVLVFLYAASAFIVGFLIGLLPAALFYLFIAWVLQFVLFALFGLGLKLVPLALFIMVVDILVRRVHSDRSTKG